MKAKNALDTDSEEDEDEEMEDKIDADQFMLTMDEFINSEKGLFGAELFTKVGDEKEKIVTDEHRMMQKEGIFGMKEELSCYDHEVSNQTGEEVVLVPGDQIERIQRLLANAQEEEDFVKSI